MQFSSQDHKKRAQAFGQLATKAQTPSAKQKMLAQQHKFQTLARAAANQELKSEQNSEPLFIPAPMTEDSASETSVTLTPSEIESLRQDKKDSGAYSLKAFSKGT